MSELIRQIEQVKLLSLLRRWYNLTGLSKYHDLYSELKTCSLSFDEACESLAVWGNAWQ